MEDVEKSQQRLQAISEKRRQQEDEERLRRETEEEWLKLAQKKRKSLRDQWLSEPAPPPADSLRSSPPLQDSPEEHTEEEPTKSQKRPEEEEGTAEASEEEDQPLQEDNTEPIDCSDTATHNHWQAGVEEEILEQVSRSAEGHCPVNMTQRMLYERGQDGRSVLGMVAVQVERDPKTGATVIRSVAPVSASSGAAMATTVFDDGRKSVHAIGGSGGQPSAEELGQILSVIDGVGMKVLLDEVTVTPQREEIIREDNKHAEEKEDKVSSYPAHTTSSQGDTAVSGGASERSGSRGLGTEQGIEGCTGRGGEEEEDEEGDNSIVVVREVGRRVDDVEDGRVEYRMEEGPVTLTFLGYTDAAAGQGQAQGQGQGQGVGVGQEHHREILTVERVIITDEGEERELQPADTAPPRATAGAGTGLDPSSEGLEDSVVAAGGGDRNVETTAGLGGEAGKGASQEGVFQDINLEGNGAGVNAQGEGDEKGAAGPHEHRAEGGGAPKRKTCQCCSVM